MWRGIAIGTCLAVLVVGVVSAQGQRSRATLDDLLAEMRALRADLNESSIASVRAQLAIGRVQVQEQRIAAIARELTDTQNLLRSATTQRERTTSFLIDLEERLQSGKVIQERRAGFEQDLVTIKERLVVEQRREDDGRRRERELTNVLALEQNRWLEFNSRLDELERALSVDRK
jgi:hypothetical protein